jgi:hypothetical protein
MTPSYSQLSANAKEGYAMYTCKNIHKKPHQNKLDHKEYSFCTEQWFTHFYDYIADPYGSVGNRKYEKQHLRTWN